MIFDELSIAIFRFSLLALGAELEGGSYMTHTPTRAWKIWRPIRARVKIGSKDGRRAGGGGNLTDEHLGGSAVAWRRPPEVARSELEASGGGSRRNRLKVK